LKWDTGFAGAVGSSDHRAATRARIANVDAPPHRYATMRPRDFLELMDPGRHYPDLDMPSENEPDPAA
jgi:hypothetical protein